MADLKSEQTLGPMLDRVVDGGSSMDSVVGILLDMPLVSLADHIDHSFFREYIFVRLKQILQRWSEQSSVLSAHDSTSFRQACSLALRMSKLLAKELQADVKLVEVVKKCLNNISSYGYYLNQYEPYTCYDMESFDYLVQAFAAIKYKPLVEYVMHCAASIFAQQALLTLTAGPMANANRFLLVTCPNYVLECDTEYGKYTHSMFSRMLSVYARAFDRLFDDSDEWIEACLGALVTPLHLIAFNIRPMESMVKGAFKWISVKVLERDIANKNVKSNKENNRWISLIHSSIRILLDFGRFEPHLLNDLQDNKDSIAKIVATLKNLGGDTEDDMIRFQATELLAFILPEQEFSEVVDAKLIVGLFIDKLNKAMKTENIDNDTHKEQMNELFSGMKSLVENRSLAAQLVQQNILPDLIKYAERSPNDEVPFEIIYAFLFTPSGKEELRKETYKEFIDKVRLLQQSGKTEVQKAADGILWKVEGEDIFKHKSEVLEKYSPPTSTSSPPGTGGSYMPQMAQMPPPSQSSGMAPYSSPPQSTSSADPQMYYSPSPPSGAFVDKYDVMISYCWANKLVCHQVYERLERDGYRVWIDRNEMHGSIIERMAEGIEKSDVFLMCMSSGYKKSFNCQAEAEYAFNRKKTIVPLIVEHKYKADGWLGFIASNKLYIQFMNPSDDEFKDSYNSLMAELKRNGISLSNDSQCSEDNVGKSDSTNLRSESFTVGAGCAPLNKAEIDKIQPATTEYRTIEKVDDWTEKHVTEFLVDRGLDALRDVLTGIDGKGLMEMHRVYEHSPDTVYRILDRQYAAISPGLFFKFMATLMTFLKNSSPDYSYF